MANMNYDAIYTDPNLLKKKKETEIGVVPTNPTVTSSTVSQPDYTSQINALAEAYKNQQIAALQNAYNKNISNLEAEKATIKPQYEQDRSKLRATSINQAKDFENFCSYCALS